MGNEAQRNVFESDLIELLLYFLVATKQPNDDIAAILGLKKGLFDKN